MINKLAIHIYKHLHSKPPIYLGAGKQLNKIKKIINSGIGF